MEHPGTGGKVEFFVSYPRGGSTPLRRGKQAVRLEKNVKILSFVLAEPTDRPSDQKISLRMSARVRAHACNAHVHLPGRVRARRVRVL